MYLNFGVFAISIKPILGSIIMINLSLFLKNRLRLLDVNKRLSGLISIGIAVIIYVFNMFFYEKYQKYKKVKTVENTEVYKVENLKRLKNKKKI